jgi:hypothetical protein
MNMNLELGHNVVYTPPVKALVWYQIEAEVTSLAPLKGTLALVKVDHGAVVKTVYSSPLENKVDRRSSADQVNAFMAAATEAYMKTEFVPKTVPTAPPTTDDETLDALVSQLTLNSKADGSLVILLRPKAQIATSNV